MLGSDWIFRFRLGGMFEDSPQHLRRVGEAVLVAAARMSTEFIGLCQLCHEIQMPAFGIVHVDSTAALRVIKRLGNGRMRHVRVGQLCGYKRRRMKS